MKTGLEKASLRSLREEAVAPWIAGALLAVPLFVARGLPMTDLALHEGMVALLARWGDAHFTQGIYALNLGHSHQLFYALALPFAFFVGSDFACRIVVAASVIATFVGAARVCDHAGASRWAALFATPAAMGWTFFYGFAPNVLGVAIFLLVLPALDRFVMAPDRAGALRAAGAVILLHAAHEASLFAACIVMIAGMRRANARAWAWRAVPFVVAAALVAIEMRAERRALTAFGRLWEKQGVQMHPVDQKMLHVGDFLMGPQGALPETMMALVVIAALAAFFVARRPPPGRTRHAVFGAALFAVYVAAPFSVNFGAFLYVRFLAPAFVLAVIALAGAHASRVAKALCIAVPATWLVVITPELAHADRERRMVDALVPQIEEGSAVAVLGLGSQGSARPYEPIALGNRVLAERGGRALHSFAEYPIAPVVVRKGMRWDEETLRVYITPANLRPAWDLTRFRYLLVRIPDAERGALVARALAPDARLVAHEGSWWLFESTLPRVAIDAPNALPPIPPPPTIQERVTAILTARESPADAARSRSP